MDDIQTPVMTTPLADVRDIPLGRVNAAATLDRLRPGADATKPAVAAFNASL